MWRVYVSLSGGEMKRYIYAYKSPYGQPKLSIELEIFNRNRIIGIYQIFDGIKEYRSLFKYEDYAHLSKDFHLYPLENNTFKKCIFCHKTSDDVDFEKHPHVIPYLLGNHFLLHYEECDDCNKHFGETLESELDKYFKPYRTLNRLKNRKGNLINTNFNKNRSFKFDENQNKFMIQLQEDEFNLNYDSNKVTIDFKQEKYTPVQVYKAFMKIFFGLLPRDHLHKFEHLRKWIINKDQNIKIFSPLTVIKTRLDGFTKTPLDVSILYKKVSSLDEFKTTLPIKENFEYLGYIRFANVVLEIPIFSDLVFEKFKVMKDSGMKLEFSFPYIPKPGYPTNNELVDFSETRQIKSKEQIFFSYDGVIEKRLVSKSDFKNES